MRDVLKIRNTRGRGFVLIAAVCVVMLLVLSTATLVHSHSGGHADPGCLLCYSAHQPVQAAAQVTLQFTAEAIARVAILWNTDRPVHNVILLPLNRPPPAVPVAA